MRRIIYNILSADNDNDKGHMEQHMYFCFILVSLQHNNFKVDFALLSNLLQM